MGRSIFLNWLHQSSSPPRSLKMGVSPGKVHFLFSFLSILSPLVVSSSLVILNNTYVLTTLRFITLKTQANISNHLFNIYALRFNLICQSTIPNLNDSSPPPNLGHHNSTGSLQKPTALFYSPLSLIHLIQLIRKSCCYVSKAAPPPALLLVYMGSHPAYCSSLLPASSLLYPSLNTTARGILLKT